MLNTVDYHAPALALIAVSAFAATPVVAQTDPNLNGSNWRYHNRLSVPAKMYSGFPDKCRAAMARAVQTYNAAGSKLVFTHSPTVTSSKNLENGQNDSDLTVSYGTTAGANIPAEAPPVRSSASTSASYGPGFRVSDADVVVNFNMLFYQTSTADSAGAFFCPSAAGQAVPTDKLDFETIVLHEMTHDAGLAHFGATNCVMYYAVSYGSAGQRRSYCPAEVSALRGLYP
jgi:hypothetical protein